MKILVTGGLGFIGSHTCVSLLDSGYEVIVLDNLSNSNIKIKDRIETISKKSILFIKGDILDFALLNSIFKEHVPSAVIHFAAAKAVGESVEYPLKYYKNNISGLVNLLEVMNENQCSNIVFSSSCTVYGQPQNAQVSELSPILPAESPYGYTKQVGENIIKDCTKTNSLKAISLRYFNPVGAHKSALIGELPIGTPNNLIPFITQTAIGIRSQLTVFGNDYNTPDGSCIRDYIHVVDLADAHVKAVDQLQKMNFNYDVFNIGTGKGNSVLEMINTFEITNQIEVNYTIGNRRNGDVEQIYANTIKSEQVLGWKAKYDIQDMLKSAWQWQLELQKNPI